MIHLANGFLVLELLLCIFAMVFALVTLRLPLDQALRVFWLVKRAVQISAVMAIHLLVITAYAFLSDNFSLAMVANHSGASLSHGYKLSAMWASAQGSFLLWTVILVCVVAMFTSRRSNQDIAFGATAVAICSMVTAAFSALLLFVVKPFAPTIVTIDQGSGLNPLLQNLWMVIHPPLLFVGYSLFLIPFVMAVASAFTGVFSHQKHQMELRRWLLISFVFLTLGIATGAKWAYVELGWGGFWGWDPVENASLLPWIVAVAALHSLAVSRKTNSAYTWTAALASLVFILCLVATFITRSGIVQSVHAFGSSLLAPALLSFIGFLIGIWLVMFIRLRQVSRNIESVSVDYLAKPNLILATNLVLLLLTIAVGLGTLWPAITSALGFNALTPSRLFYDRIASVSGIVLVVLVGLCSLVPWNGAAKPAKKIIWCLAAAIAAAALSVLLGEPVLNVFAQSSAAFATVSLFMTLPKLFKAKNDFAKAGRLVSHLGLIIFVAATSASVMGETSKQFALAKGDRGEIGNYELVYDNFQHEESAGQFNVGPVIMLAQGSFKTSLWPHNRITDNQQTAEVGLYSGLWRDVYVVFDGCGEQNKVLLTVYIKPLMNWLWASMLLIAVGALASMARGKSQ